MSSNTYVAASPFLILLLLVCVYWLTVTIRKRTGNPFVNPMLFGTIFFIVYLKLTDTPYSEFEKTGKLIGFWLQPAVVCLAIPLYLQWQKIRAQWLPIIASQVVGCVVGIVSGVWIANALGASREVSVALVAKSVTLPIALEVTQVLGGVPAVSAAGVIVAGLTGQMVGFAAMKYGIHNPISKSVAQGTASHAIGIATCLEKSGRFAAYATLGLILNGVMTAFLAPLIVPFLAI
ncbi:LrgB family protein [Alysiella filiformis]|uniref:TIGR00659 family protein n=1 Tax=Alysiella filiformis DSM 16848 TaxID=1120981 RepID=A0A286E2J8_9NEIS|nr:LrgB family protein [Alysiella filiformis]QMT30910.1 LrgB family protein [Alysiella filiformis]UBQ56104.1 LrgB family protein [Alysiella filiformis DSM 16848]SOD65112.1 TIGR00659 family protein [Alysiella filiformis DSM 16848]